MRILHVNSYYSTSPFYKNLFDIQLEAGHELMAYVPVPTGYDGKQRDFGAYARVSPCFPAASRALFFWKHGLVLRDAVKVTHNFSATLIHAHSLLSNGYIAHRLSLQTGAPYLVAVRDSDVNVIWKYRPYLAPLAKRILQRASRVIFISQPYSERALKPYLSPAEFEAVRAKSDVLPNGLDPMWLTNRAQKPLVQPGRLKVLAVGRIIRRKNLALAADAIKILRERGLDATLTVAGNPECEELVQNLVSRSYVTVLPPRPMAELMPIYRAHDLFLLPSLRETFGIVYAEAMSQGLPVLYSRGQGFDGQFAEGEVGYSVDPQNPAEMADRIALADGQLTAIAGRALAQSARFDWNILSAHYQKIYEGIITKAK